MISLSMATHKNQTQHRNQQTKNQTKLWSQLTTCSPDEVRTPAPRVGRRLQDNTYGQLGQQKDKRILDWLNTVTCVAVGFW